MKSHVWIECGNSATRASGKGSKERITLSDKWEVKEYLQVCCRFAEVLNTTYPKQYSATARIIHKAWLPLATDRLSFSCSLHADRLSTTN